jgi:squalene cyclase
MAGAARGADGDASRLPKLVDEPIAKAISRGLDYLAKTQQPDGSVPANFSGRSYPAAMTSLAGLAFLSSGSTPSNGLYAENIRRAMVYLMQMGDSHPDGLIAGKVEARCTYGHGFAMMFLALCYGMEPSGEYEQRLKHTLDRAIRLVANGQSDKGGWLYSPVGKGGDEGSTTACVLQGLRACRNAGLKVPTETIDKAVGYLKHCQNPDGGIAYSAVSRGYSRTGISVAAIACYYAAGVYDRKAGGESSESAFVDRLWRYVDENVKDVSNDKDFQVYTNFYLAQAKYQRGNSHWEPYYKKIARDLVSSQRPNGSWPGEDVGPVYGTSVALMILQLPYNYLPFNER